MRLERIEEERLDSKDKREEIAIVEEGGRAVESSNK